MHDAGWSWDLKENVTWTIINTGDNVTLGPGQWRNYTLNISSSGAGAEGDQSWVLVELSYYLI